MDNTFLISGIQQIGVGTTDIYRSWKWYAEYFQINVRILEDQNVADIMAPYMGGAPHKKHACIAMNMQGGGGFEIWQFSDREPTPVGFQIGVGDLGIFAGKIKSRDVNQFYQEIGRKYFNISPLYKNPLGEPTFYILDPFGNYFQVVEDTFIYIEEKNRSGGCVGAMIGVSDIEQSLKVYRDILGYDTVIYDQTGTFEDFGFMHKGTEKYRRVLLSHSQERKGAFSELLGKSTLELVTALERQPCKIYENRYWGDPGFIQLCFDITNMKALEVHCEKQGFPFTVDSCKNPNISFDMGDAAGQFTYIEDPDGTLIEFVETHKIPIFKKLGWYLNLRKRNREKPLPKWMLRVVGLNKV
jgi:catechol 2,3-dioxygenase-like lactoylglutathione lyase family enzyme